MLLFDIIRALPVFSVKSVVNLFMEINILNINAEKSAIYLSGLYLVFLASIVLKTTTIEVIGRFVVN
jgi:hypothetical protein